MPVPFSQRSMTSSSTFRYLTVNVWTVLAWELSNEVKMKAGKC